MQLKIYRAETGRLFFGPPHAAVTIAPEWTIDLPPRAEFNGLQLYCQPDTSTGLSASETVVAARSGIWGLSVAPRKAVSR